MKFISTFVLIFLLIGSSTIAQDTTDVNKNIILGGGRYDNGVVFSAGYGISITKNIWSFSYMDIGNYQAFNTEVAYIFSVPGVEKFKLGLLAGPNADWAGPYENDNIPAISYLVGAAGGIGTYDVSDKIGLWGYMKYRFAFTEEDAYKDGYLGGAGLFYKF